MSKNTSKLPAKNVAIIGGGIAGLAAAASLAKQGIAVTVLEAGSHLGGRARSVAIEANSRVVQLDNGQHIMLGAYHETLKLLESVGVPESTAFMRLPLTLDLRAGKQHAFKLSTPSYLPAPINLLIGFLCCAGLQFNERLAVIKFMLKLKKTQYTLVSDEPLLKFLQQNQQSNNIIALLWEPLCLAALNTPMDIASSRVFLNVLRDSFNGKKTDSNFLLPKHDLSQIFSNPILRYLKVKHAKVLYNQRVKSIEVTQNGYLVVTKGLRTEFSHLIIAVSPTRLQAVTANLPELAIIAEKTEQYEYQPIVTIYLQYPNNATISMPMVGLTGTLSQWVFDRGILCNQHGLMAVMISAQGKHQKYTHDALALRVAQELHQAFPNLNKPLWHKVIAEKRATFSCTVDLHRPMHATAYPNLYLAGDYTYANYPATIEGAVRSGIACADLVSNS